MGRGSSYMATPTADRSGPETPLESYLTIAGDRVRGSDAHKYAEMLKTVVKGFNRNANFTYNRIACRLDNDNQLVHEFPYEVNQVKAVYIQLRLCNDSVAQYARFLNSNNNTISLDLAQLTTPPLGEIPKF
jgi:hypothetical protein